MSGFNLSDWALNHALRRLPDDGRRRSPGRSRIRELGRNEDPTFIIKTMVVQARGPARRRRRRCSRSPSGSSASCRRRRTSTSCAATPARRSTIFVDLKDRTPASAVPGIWYQVRKKIGDIRHTLPAGVVGPVFNDDFGDTFGIIYGFTADGFTPSRAARLCREHALGAAAACRTSRRSRSSARRTSGSSSSSRRSSSPVSAIDRDALIAALQAQNVVSAGRRRSDRDEQHLGPRLRRVRLRADPQASTSSPAAACSG